MDGCAGSGIQGGKATQDNLAQPQGIDGDGCRLADSVHLQQVLPHPNQGLLNLISGQARCHVPVQLIGTEKQGQMTDHLIGQDRQAGPHGPIPHRCKQIACFQDGLHPVGGQKQPAFFAAGRSDIDRQLIFDGVLFKNANAVGNHRVARRHGFDNIRVDGQAGQGNGQKDRPDDHNGHKGKRIDDGFQLHGNRDSGWQRPVCRRWVVIGSGSTESRRRSPAHAPR